MRIPGRSSTQSTGCPCQVYYSMYIHTIHRLPGSDTIFETTLKHIRGYVDVLAILLDTGLLD